ncbi:MAG: TetR/AcrR family transcriptional regulator [Desulfomonilaceae bacterium]
MNNFLFAEANRELENLSRRERENLRQREEILQTALKLFSEKRYHNVSMHEIAKEAEFGIGTIYKFFVNKEDLYRVLIMETAEKWHHAVIQALEQERNPLRAIKRYIAIQRELFFSNLPVVRLYHAETKGTSFNAKAGFDQDLLKLRDLSIKKLASVLEIGIKEKVFRDADPYHMALALHGIIDAFLFRMIEDPARFRRGDELSGAADIFLKGVLSK